MIGDVLRVPNLPYQPIAWELTPGMCFRAAGTAQRIYTVMEVDKIAQTVRFERRNGDGSISKKVSRELIMTYGQFMDAIRIGLCWMSGEISN